MKGASDGSTARTRRVDTQLNGAIVQKLDDLRAGSSRQPPRPEAARLPPEEKSRADQRTGKEQRFRRACPDARHLGALYVLESVSGFGPAKFRAMHNAGIDPQEAIGNPDLLPFSGRTGEKLRHGIAALPETDLAAGGGPGPRAVRAVGTRRRALGFHPGSRGPGLSGSRVCEQQSRARAVRSRRPGDSGQRRVGRGRRFTEDTRTLRGRCSIVCEFGRRGTGFAVVSGFAVGADSIGHRAALDAGGRTVCVMPCGLDRVFPPENRGLWEELLTHPGAAFAGEFGFGQRASSFAVAQAEQAHRGLVPRVCWSRSPRSTVAR